MVDKEDRYGSSQGLHPCPHMDCVAALKFAQPYCINMEIAPRWDGTRTNGTGCRTFSSNPTASGPPNR